MTRLTAMLLAVWIFPIVPTQAQELPSANAAPSELAALAGDVVTIDLPTALKLSRARNLDIAEAQARLKQGRGLVSSAIGALLPTASLGVGAVGIEGAVPAAGGAYQVGQFHRVSPFALANWIINPGQAVFDILAARRRLGAAKDDAAFVGDRVEHDVAMGYYGLALAQALVQTTTRRVEESRELLRLSQARENAGLGLALDTQRAREASATAAMAQIAALNDYYAASVGLAKLLNLTPVTLLVPAADALKEPSDPAEAPQLDLLLTSAVTHRSDLAALRRQIGASDATKVAVLFAALGPQFQGSALASNTPPTAGINDTMFRQQPYSASAAITLSGSVFGKVQIASANRALADVTARRKLEEVRAEVVTARQNVLAAARSLVLVRERLAAGEAALALANAGLRSGTSIAFDVLTAQTVVQDARFAHAQALAQYRSALATLDFVTGQKIS